jgi:hypothetical protein
VTSFAVASLILMIRCPRKWARDGTINTMRLWLLILTSFPLLAFAASPCAPTPRIPGTPIDAPHAVFEAYVVDVHATQISASEFGVLRTRRALVEVSRSFHGPYSPGQQVETLTIEGSDTCGSAVESGAHVMVRSETGGAFEIVEVFPAGVATPHGLFAALALVKDEPRHSRRPSLKNASWRGAIDAGHAAQLRERAQPRTREHCEISSAGEYAQVTWGKAFGGNDARHKVIFERVAGEWVEILRYEAPTPTPVRTRPRRGSKRTLWARNGDIPHFAVTIG